MLVFLPNNDHSHANLMEVQNIYSPARGNKSSIKRYDFSTRRANIELCFLNEDISTVDLNIMVKCVVNQTLQCHTYQDILNDLVSKYGKQIYSEMCQIKFRAIISVSQDVIVRILFICFKANIEYSVFNTLMKSLYQFWNAHQHV